MRIPTWHYMIEKIVVKEPIDASQLHQIGMKLDDLGMKGWEAVTNVVGATPGQVYVLFKRRGPEDTTI